MSRNQSATTSEIVYGKISPKIIIQEIHMEKPATSQQPKLDPIFCYKYWNSLNETTRKSRSPKLTPSPFFYTQREYPRTLAGHTVWLLMTAIRERILMDLKCCWPWAVEIVVSRLTPPKTNMLALENPFCWKMNSLLEWPMLRWRSLNFQSGIILLWLWSDAAGIGNPTQLRSSNICWPILLA